MMMMATSCAGELWPAWGHPRLMSREAAVWNPHVFFLSGCQQLRQRNNVNFSIKGRRVKAQLSFLLFLAEQYPICGRKCYCWVGYNCFQRDNPHHFRAFKGSIRTCKYIVIYVFGVMRGNCVLYHPKLIADIHIFPVSLTYKQFSA